MMIFQIVDIDDEVGLYFFELYKFDVFWGYDGGEQGVAIIMGFNCFVKIGVIILINQGEVYLEDLFVGVYQLGVKF